MYCRMGVYGPAIVLVNLLLLISSTVLIYLGSMLVNFYLLPTLSILLNHRLRNSGVYILQNNSRGAK